MAKKKEVTTGARVATGEEEAKAGNKGNKKPERAGTT